MNIALSSFDRSQLGARAHALSSSCHAPADFLYDVSTRFRFAHPLILIGEMGLNELVDRVKQSDFRELAYQCALRQSISLLDGFRDDDIQNLCVPFDQKEMKFWIIDSVHHKGLYERKW